jgi:DNA-binding response OmpR family regulator
MKPPQPGQKKILVVGADPATQDVLCQALSDGCFQILSAINGGDALYQFGTARPDLIILDMNGWETLEQIRDMSEIPIIALGQSDDPEAIVQTLDHGADYFLTKPFGSLELCARIRALLRRVKSESLFQFLSP